MFLLSLIVFQRIAIIQQERTIFQHNFKVRNGMHCVNAAQDNNQMKLMSATAKLC